VAWRCKLRLMPCSSHCRGRIEVHRAPGQRPPQCPLEGLVSFRLHSILRAGGPVRLGRSMQIRIIAAVLTQSTSTVMVDIICFIVAPEWDLGAAVDALIHRGAVSTRKSITSKQNARLGMAEWAQNTSSVLSPEAIHNHLDQQCRPRESLRNSWWL
jgi:hypothetical protein